MNNISDATVGVFAWISWGQCLAVSGIVAGTSSKLRSYGQLFVGDKEEKVLWIR